MRKAGKVVAPMKVGVCKGYKQTPEHIEKRKRFGTQHPAWVGDNACVKTGRTRALRKYSARPCSVCGSEKAERHHIDGNTLNNEAENIVFVCRKCHMTKDGRIEQAREQATRNQPMAVDARWNKTVLH